MCVLKMFAPVILLVSLLLQFAHAQESNDSGNYESRAPIPSDSDERLFKKLFAERRKDHLAAVNGLRKMDSYEQQYKIIMMLAEKAFQIVESSRNTIENVSFVPGEDSFPQDVAVRDALSSILENVALFGDIILHLPDVSHRILGKRKDWNAILEWSLNFADSSRHLLDKSTITMIQLLKQELDITARDPDYHNPYWSRELADKANGKSTSRKVKALKKEKRKKGPRITRLEL